MLKRIGRGRREKLFGDGRPVPLDRNGKARLMVLARALVRRTEPGRAYGAVTAKALAVLEALLFGFHNADSGKCFPGYARIAEKAGCAASTVGEAIRMLERAGLLTWVNRLARIRRHQEGLGWRVRVIRTSNSYRFIDPQAAGRSQPPAVRPRQSSKTDLPSGTGIQEDSLSDAPERRGSLQGEQVGNAVEAALARLGKLVRKDSALPKTAS
ncbi:helix-turn-helix domain-containing protein [Lichenihabitans sp. Uapishka_5]|uniref:helix-turn-helix domain-containing protein n=1 Tax=Lichenihabitans sp. Uapishka_5 TaxID=3037302 RepID=UPI0029E7E627|nr:helix-turn-helix domain-containing protein [Lichenihabitans sp. Uapishka_5]MDX7953357.1 helix-turn-helix domain-containing protein [Lichenihabitans sp. Uapishka_5]